MRSGLTAITHRRNSRGEEGGMTLLGMILLALAVTAVGVGWAWTP